MTNEETWSLEIKPKTGWFDIHLKELWRYRDLIMLFVRRDFVAQYKQTVLGPLWFIIQPVFSTLIFTVIFGKLAKLPTDGVPPFLFYMCGNIAWGYFSSCLSGTSNTFVSNASIFGKVYFPRLCVPVSVIISTFFKFFIQFGLFILFLVYYCISGLHISFSVWLLTFPLLLLQMALLGLGFGILISSLTTKYRDFSYLVGFGVQLWMYATPIVYPLSMVPEKYRGWLLLNPMAPIVETFRRAFLGTGSIDLKGVLIGWFITIAVLFIGILLFSKVEKSFMDTV
jgi:lipopolysaccharide transport system permease protein